MIHKLWIFSRFTSRCQIRILDYNTRFILTIVKNDVRQGFKILGIALTIRYGPHRMFQPLIFKSLVSQIIMDSHLLIQIIMILSRVFQ